MNSLQFVLGSITTLPVHLYFSVMLVRGLNSARVVNLSFGKLMLDRSSATEPVTLKVNKITQWCFNSHLTQKCHLLVNAKWTEVHYRHISVSRE